MPFRVAAQGSRPFPESSQLLERLQQLNQIGVALSRETDINRLLETTLVVAKGITNADGGTLYRVTEGHTLKFEIMRTDSLGIAMGGTTGVEIRFDPIRLYDEDGRKIVSNVAGYAYHHDTSMRIADAYSADGFDFSGTKTVDRVIGYRSQSFLTVPMKNHNNEIIGILQLLNATDPATGRTVEFSLEHQHLAESLASQAAIALTNRLLINHLEYLFESFIKLINQAIDDKSPHTGKHCDRVPVLTMMIANAAENCGVGALKDFAMTEQDRYALKIAGLLHDCGKVTTPVHVIDKATKLQTIYDRIHDIETRFEVITRDARIALLQAQLEARESGGPQISRDAELRFEQMMTEISNDREFLRICNLGAEVMKPEDIRRVHQIATKYTWRDLNGNIANFLTGGEIENLIVRTGTLTAAERRIINHHIDVTIQMLEALPWPRHLKNVPEYAGGHHERMDGTGYPRGLKREQMSVQARCMGIADIFEALTAEDRPYKRAKTLSEALAILGNFKLNGQIDPDIFDVFMWGKVYLRFARQYMKPELIDEIDLSTIPGYEPPPAGYHPPQMGS